MLFGLVNSILGCTGDGTLIDAEVLGTIDEELQTNQSVGPVNDAIEVWSGVANDACAVDHTPGGPHVLGAQAGPVRTARAMAIIHLAMFETLNAIDARYKSFVRIPPVHRPGRVDARSAITHAAYTTLTAMYPSQEEEFRDKRDAYLGGTKNTPSAQRGKALGTSVANRVIATRAHDGSNHDEPLIGCPGDRFHYCPKDGPGAWKPDPIANQPVALGARWPEVDPFVMRSAHQFRIPPPPMLSSPQYASAFNEVKQLGGDGVVTPTQRTSDQTVAGIYWGYDGTALLGTPPRLYNQIALEIAQRMGTRGIELARLMALVNVAMADAGLAAWESKYHYNFARPITAIREAGMDGNPATVPDENYTPLGAPATNSSGSPNFTPPFPAYPSGHATFGGAVFEMLRNFYLEDDIDFTFVSDEFNGVNADNGGNARLLIPRSFASLSDAEEENGQSRIYLGIHWKFDKTAGVVQGHNVADYIFNHAFQPL